MRRRWDTLWNSGVRPPLVGQASVGGSMPDEGHQGSEQLVSEGEESQMELAASEHAAADQTPRETNDDLWLPYLRKIPRSASFEVARCLDISKLGFTDARWLVSRKKVRGLSDILNKLKRETLDEHSRLQLLNEARRLPLDTEEADGDLYEGGWSDMER